MKMIQEKELIEIGKILKTHGVKGEMTFLFNKEEYVDVDTEFYFFLLDGLYVPFFVEDFRFSSNDSAIIKIEEIDTVEEAATYSDTLIFLPKELLKNIEKETKVESEWEQFIDYTVFDEHNKLIGVIESVDSSTINVLFVVVNDKDIEILIPATTDFILEIDSDKKELYLSLPEGLLED